MKKTEHAVSERTCAVKISVYDTITQVIFETQCKEFVQ